MVELSAVLADLAAESEELDQVVAGLSDEQWALDTPAAGWTIAHQIAHLAWTDEQASLAASKPDAFLAELERVTAGTDPLALVDDAAAAGAQRSPAELLAAWRQGRAELSDALASVPGGAKVPWFGPPMSPASMATARIMETWAHGQDVYDTFGVTREPTDRLRHVAHIGVRTRDFAYAVNGMPAPTESFRIELTAPNGDVWTWGPDDAPQRVTGDALEFCLLVTQRRHRDDTSLAAVGADADTWLGIAQAFAGPPGGGRKPEQGGGQ